MKKIAFILITFMAFSLGAQAQAFKKAYYDSEYILSKIPSYEQAEKQLDELAQKWQAEVETQFKKAQELYKAYQKEEVLLSAEMKKKKQDEIILAETEAKKLNQKYFSQQDGELAKKEKELIDPLMNEILNMVQEIATEGGYTEMVDLALAPEITYHDTRFDESDNILKKMGYGQE